MSVPLNSRPFDRDSFRQVAESFHQAHEREHGYRDESIPLEVVFIRVFAEGAIDKPRLKKHPLAPNGAHHAQVGTRKVWFLYSPTPLSTAIYKRELLTAGSTLEGPAIVEQLDATTLILPGMRAEVDEYLNLIITTRVNEERAGVDGSQMTGEGKADPIFTEVIRNAFEAVANEMSSTLKRSAMSLVINEYEDYSGVLSDGDGNIVRHGERDLPVHSGSMQFSVQKIIKDVGKENLRPGDVYILNDPYEGGTHKHDVRVVAPAFFEGEIIGYLTTSGHWPDIGGAVPGSFYNQATDYYQEGLMIPTALIYREGKFNDDVERLILANLRQPKVTRGDLRAMISAVKCGERRLVELAKKYGKATLKREMKEYQDHSERMLRKIVSGLKDGRYEWEDYIDQDPATAEKEPKKIKLALIIQGDQITFDLTGTDRATGPINASLSGTTSIILAMINGIFNEIPFNYGVIKSITVTAPEHTLVNAKSPAPIEGMSMTFDILTSTIMGAFSQVVPDRVIACMGGVTNILWGAWNPHHEPPRYFVAYVAIEIGWGGRATKDGLQGRLLFIGGGIRNIPIELAEKEYCVLVEQVAVRQDSEGAGKFRGGCGYQRIMRVDEDVSLSSISDREKFAPFGLFDGESSTVATVILNPDTPEETDIGLYFSNTLVRKGARVKMMTSGGGGYGPPLERDPAAVLQDVLHGYISPKRAKNTYGVVLKEEKETSLSTTYTIDAEATQKLRGKRGQ
jgi:N-methylhydantoinase B